MQTNSFVLFTCFSSICDLSQLRCRRPFRLNAPIVVHKRHHSKACFVLLFFHHSQRDLSRQSVLSSSNVQMHVQSQVPSWFVLDQAAKMMEQLQDRSCVPCVVDERPQYRVGNLLTSIDDCHGECVLFAIDLFSIQCSFIVSMNARIADMSKIQHRVHPNCAYNAYAK